MWSCFLNLILVIFFLQTEPTALINNDVKIIKLKPQSVELELMADKSAALSTDEQIFFYRKNADTTQPIASITKLMTALVFLDHNPGWESNYTIQERDQVQGGVLNLWPGDIVSIRDLFKTSLIASDNGATLALVHATNLSEEDFIKKMNEKALKFRLVKTKFVDPIGLGDKNISTAREVALLAKIALARQEISEATGSKDYQFKTLGGKEKKIESTDYLLFDSAQNTFQVLGGKTGYTDRAGYCFVGRFRAEDGREMISVILNSQGKNERFRESKSLVNWVFGNYNW